MGGGGEWYAGEVDLSVIGICMEVELNGLTKVEHVNAVGPTMKPWGTPWLTAAGTE